jgi:hypothetical protein
MKKQVMKHAIGKTEQQTSKRTKYADVKYDSRNKIEGLTNMGFGEKVDVKFSASPDLMAVSLAMELDGSSITLFMRLADGYGTPGYFPGGYDWSGIRDSTPAAIERMFIAAKKILNPHKGQLVEMGLPGKLVKDLTE